MTPHGSDGRDKTRYPMDNYDGGRSACEPEHFRRSELGFVVRRSRGLRNDDDGALALAVIALMDGSRAADDQ